MRVIQYLDNPTKSIAEQIWLSSFDTCTLDLPYTLPILSSISQHQHCAVAFYHQNNWVVSFKTIDQPDVLFEITDFYNFNANELIAKFKESVFLHSDCHVETVHLFSAHDCQLNKKIVIFLFSDRSHQLTPKTTQLIYDYLLQQTKRSELIVENTQFKEKIDALEEISSGRTKYLSVISHDLRAPFHGILGCVDILMNESETLNEHDKNKLIEYIYDTSHSTYILLENLLNWSMSQGGRFYLKQVNFRIGDVVQMVLDLLCASAYKKQIKIECELEASLYVYADINMVTSVLQNLMSNALKFTQTEANKTITITTSSENGRAKIAIKDQGIGLTTTQQEKLFKEHSVSTTPGTQGEKGTGLGLVLCKRFVEMNDGEIYVSSILGEGTTFTLNFPLGNKEH